jgi:hypothetical protein
MPLRRFSTVGSGGQPMGIRHRPAKLQRARALARPPPPPELAMTSAIPTLPLAAAAFAVALALGGAAQAEAQAKPKATASDVERMSETVTVQSVDTATRHLVVKRPSGETVSLKAPAEVRNFEKLKPGDTISATYYREVVLALSAPNAKLPENTATLLTARAAKGEMPGGVAATRIVVSGAVLGVDRTNHVLKVVNPEGGEVHEISVVDPQARQMMDQMKVGDRITAYVNESLLISVTPG